MGMIELLSDPAGEVRIAWVCHITVCDRIQTATVDI